MSTEQDQARILAERIARRLSQHDAGSQPGKAPSADGVSQELAAMRASLSELQNRLSHIESHLTQDETEASGPQSALARGPSSSARESTQDERQSIQSDAPQTRSPWLSGVYVPATHPSQEKFGINEATVSELVDFFEKEKTCSLEPGGKPCDHCAMCNTRGF
ncbi:MAG TPA: hypothetical protein VGB17_02520 [Pyrinomonadaceae bacterium]|jgi:hypothetical protein